jgi:hypothetical protein
MGATADSAQVAMEESSLPHSQGGITQGLGDKGHVTEKPPRAGDICDPSASLATGQKDIPVTPWGHLS